MNISKLADIHPDAVIGKNVEIESFAKVDRDVVIGDNTWIGAQATIYPGARIGKGCKIFPGAVIAAIPQDLKFAGEYSTVEIGDYTTIREYATVNRGTASKGVTRVGKHSLLMAYSHVGHDAKLGNHCVIANSVQIAGEVTLEDWVVIGGMSAIHQFCRIGAHAMVSGMSGVLSDVAPFTKAFGVPAKYMGVNTVGLKRRGYNQTQINHIHNIYRIIFQEGLNISMAIDYMQLVMDVSEDMAQIIQFFNSSQRGIIKGEYSQKKILQRPGDIKVKDLV